MADFFAKGNKPINGYGGVDEGVIYSTEEHIIGKWIDGSTLYEKTIDCGAMPNNTTKRVAHGISNLNLILSVKGMSWDINSHIYQPLPIAHPTLSNLNIYISSTDINFETGYNWSNYNTSYVTLRYTKTS